MREATCLIQLVSKGEMSRHTPARYPTRCKFEDWRFWRKHTVGILLLPYEDSEAAVGAPSTTMSTSEARRE
jgi:hypothetical protein